MCGAGHPREASRAGQDRESAWSVNMFTTGSRRRASAARHSPVRSRPPPVFAPACAAAGGAAGGGREKHGAPPQTLALSWRRRRAGAKVHHRCGEGGGSRDGPLLDPTPKGVPGTPKGPPRPSASVTDVSLGGPWRTRVRQSCPIEEGTTPLRPRPAGGGLTREAGPRRWLGVEWSACRTHGAR